jgi:putative membrane protein
LRGFGGLRGTLAIAHAVLWCGGVVSYAVRGGTPQGAEWAPPLTLALALAIAALHAPPGTGPWLAAAGAVGLGAEIAGVHTGVPFGRYTYTPALGPMLLGVPLAIGAAWVVLAACALSMAAAWTPDRRGRALLAAAWMVAMDLVLDPLASGPLGLWSWDSPGRYHGVPLSNFAGWFAVSLVIFLAAPAAPSRAALRSLGASLAVFFGVVAAAAGQLAPALVAAALAGASIATEVRARKRHGA